MKPYYEEAGITIYHGDCREILPQLGRFDLLLTDPPYGIGAARKGRGGQQHGKALCVSRDYGDSAWDDSPVSDELLSSFRELCDFQIVFGGNYFTLPPARCWFFWDKINGSNGYADGEMAWTNLDKAVRMFRHQWHGMLREGNEERFHPTQKPLALMKWCITQVSHAVCSLLDPFAGSGTTLVAAKDLGIIATGIELEERYCEIAANRLRQSVLNFEGVA